MMRAAFIRIIAIGIVVAAPFILWWQWKNQQSSGSFDIRAAFEGTPVVAPRLKPVNIYEFDQTWITQNNQRVQLQSFRGKPALVGFIYTQCPTACSVMTLKMKEVENWLPATVRERMHFLSFSIDPERDTPEHLKEYAFRFQSTGSQWQFMASEIRQVKELAKAFSFYFKKEGEFFVHSDMMAVVDQNGTIRQQFWGSPAPDEIAAAFKKLDEAER
ncbi:MAG: SCO family protein [SAR324 cluster bacterium]|nr:SCO family protein [SAR324 cluster bacterium]